MRSLYYFLFCHLSGAPIQSNQQWIQIQVINRHCTLFWAQPQWLHSSCRHSRAGCPQPLPAQKTVNRNCVHSFGRFLSTDIPASICKWGTLFWAWYVECHHMASTGVWVWGDRTGPSESGLSASQPHSLTTFSPLSLTTSAPQPHNVALIKINTGHISTHQSNRDNKPRLCCQSTGASQHILYVVYIVRWYEVWGVWGQVTLFTSKLSVIVIVSGDSFFYLCVSFCILKDFEKP